MNYSQNEEQAAILEAVKDMPTGRFLDIGAYEGITFSNTRALAGMGWGGVLVEPGAQAFARLWACYGHLPDRFKLLQTVVGIESRDLVEFWDCGDFYSTTEESNREKWQHATQFYKVLMPQIGITDLLMKFQPFDVVSIDTEGTSVRLLGKMLATGALPRVICVEHDGQDLMAISKMFGYSITYQSPENVVMVRK